jgi:hypothetical protein
VLIIRIRIVSFQVESLRIIRDHTSSLRMKTPQSLIIDEPELTTSEIAERLRVNPATIRIFFKEGMPGRKVSYRQILFRLSDCNRWLEEREAKKEKERQARARARQARARTRVAAK